MRYLIAVHLKRTDPKARFSAQVVDYLTTVGQRPPGNDGKDSESLATLTDRLFGRGTKKNRGFCHAEVSLAARCKLNRRSTCELCTLFGPPTDNEMGMMPSDWHHICFVITGSRHEPRVHLRTAKFQGTWATIHRPMEKRDFWRTARFLHRQLDQGFNSWGFYLNFWPCMPSFLVSGHKRGERFDKDHCCAPRESWFCSELVAAALLCADERTNIGDKDPAQCSPNTLYRYAFNTLYRPEGWIDGPPKFHSYEEPRNRHHTIDVTDY